MIFKFDFLLVSRYPDNCIANKNAGRRIPGTPHQACSRTALKPFGVPVLFQVPTRIRALAQIYVHNAPLPESSLPHLWVSPGQASTECHLLVRYPS
jgi:hypothetical protein